MKRLILLFLCSLASAQVTNYARMLSGVNYQTGTTYIFQAVDSTRVTQFNNAGAVSVTLPAGSTTGFQAGTVFSARNSGSGAVTITCSSCTINSVATFTLTTGQSADIYSDGNNYVAYTGAGSGGSGGNGFTLKASVAGLVCNGVTDDTAALNAADTTIYNAGGGTLFFDIQGVCLIQGQITLPNDGISHSDPPGTTSAQQPLRWTSGGMNGWPNNVFTFTGTTGILNLTYNAPNYKIITYGMGNFEIDHMTLEDTNTDCTPFIFSSSTSLRIHDSAFIGSTTSVPPVYSCNDIITLGAQNTAITANSLNSGFQGYNTVIRDNAFDKVRRGIVMNFYVNSITIQNNRDWADSGCLNCGFIEMTGTGSIPNSGNTIIGNVMEIPSRPSGINVTNVANGGNTFINNACFDPVTFSTVCVNTPSGAQQGNTIVGGYSGAYNVVASDTWDLFLAPYITGNTNSLMPLYAEFGTNSSSNGAILMPFPYGVTISSGLAIVANANEVDCLQFTLPFATTVGHITARLNSTFGAGSHWSWGIYLRSGSLLISTGALDATVTSAVTTSVTSTQMRPDVYFACQTATSSTGTAEAINGFSTVAQLAAHVNTSVVRLGKCANASSAGVLPATCGGLTAITAGAFPVAATVEP